MLKTQLRNVAHIKSFETRFVFRFWDAGTEVTEEGGLSPYQVAPRTTGVTDDLEPLVISRSCAHDAVSQSLIKNKFHSDVFRLPTAFSPHRASPRTPASLFCLAHERVFFFLLAFSPCPSRFSHPYLLDTRESCAFSESGQALTPPQFCEQIAREATRNARGGGRALMHGDPADGVEPSLKFISPCTPEGGGVVTYSGVSGI
ncbi:hypothetical protein EDB92DRAFT_1843998 [Lactarius akahatsu]|uniref:Uncharacterized protein n=1 Tax=Lactarius akahatsu TaxID=416441 RepID=A0AAD4LQY9_9AGAM|nr:hypothetical protein EDB92DRAFT_1843998 [Lactarius akahatsu]